MTYRGYSPTSHKEKDTIGNSFYVRWMSIIYHEENFAHPDVKCIPSQHVENVWTVLKKFICRNRQTS
ncbi:hypothetical protein HZS_6672, partial [Henneguya salminicola]